MMHISKGAILAGAVALVLSGPAMAASCPKHMADIDAALAKSPQLTAQQLNDVKAQRAKGEADHKAGKHGDSMDALGKAKKTLGIQ
jgi:hypothetical protein